MLVQPHISSSTGFVLGLTNTDGRKSDVEEEVATLVGVLKCVGQVPTGTYSELEQISERMSRSRYQNTSSHFSGTETTRPQIATDGHVFKPLPFTTTVFRLAAEPTTRSRIESGTLLLSFNVNRFSVLLGKKTRQAPGEDTTKTTLCFITTLPRNFKPLDDDPGTLSNSQSCVMRDTEHPNRRIETQHGAPASLSYKACLSRPACQVHYSTGDFGEVHSNPSYEPEAYSRQAQGEYRK
ncbi:hypothetical protein Bbelb_272780 [Branchiostoma belcheri]|nr:hypothetical protein Bbelb_272780 [Branchiostoma belcheri]